MREAEIDRIRRSRFESGRRHISCRYWCGSGPRSTARGQRGEADDELLTSGDRMAAELKATPVLIINRRDSLKELVIKFEWNRLMCKCKGLGINY